MKIQFLSLIALATLISLSSCETHDDVKPVITLSTPTNEQDYEIGDTIFIHGDLTDNEALHEASITLTKEETGTTAFTYEPTVHDAETFHIDTFFVPTDLTHIHFKLKIAVWDHDNNSAELDYTLHWAD